MKMLLRLLILYSIPLLLFAFVHATVSGESEINKGRLARALRVLFGNAIFLLFYALMFYWWEIQNKHMCSHKCHSQRPNPNATNSNSRTVSSFLNEQERLDKNDSLVSAIRPPPFRPKRNYIFLFDPKFYTYFRPIVLTVLLILTMISFWTNMFWCDREPTWLGVISYASFYLFLQLFVFCIYLLCTHFILRLSHLPNHFPKMPWNAMRLSPILLYLGLSTSLAFYYGAIEPRVVEVPLRFRPGIIPDQFNGYRIAQLTDIHLGISFPISNVK